MKSNRDAMKGTGRAKAISCSIASAAAVITATVPAAALGAAADYPAKVVRIVVPATPGGSADSAARAIAIQLTERLGRTVIVDNRGGAGGVVGTEQAAKSAPDGYTLLGVGAFYGTNPAFYKLPFDPVSSFIPIAKLGRGEMMLVVHPSLPVRSVKELVALAKRRPGELLWASSAVGQTQHVAAELFKVVTAVDVRIVHYKGGGPASIALIGGHTQVTISSLVTMLDHVRDGKLRALAVGGKARSPFLPDVPTFVESGVSGYEVYGWWGILAPAGTPSAIVDRLDREIKASVDSDTIRKFFASQGAEPDYLGPAEFRDFLVRDIALWKRVVKEAKIAVPQ